MYKIILAFLAAALALSLSCSDRKASSLEPQLENAPIVLTLAGSDQENILKPLSDREKLAETFYNEFKTLVDAPDSILRQMADAKAQAALGEPIYLSKYEVPFLPKPEDRDPTFGYMTLKTGAGTFYFVMPPCLCGHVIPEKKYGMEPGDEDYMCNGCPGD